MNTVVKFIALSAATFGAYFLRRLWVAYNSISKDMQIRREVGVILPREDELLQVLDTIGGADMENYRGVIIEPQCAVCAFCGADNTQDGVFNTLCGKQETIIEQVDPENVQEICPDCEPLMMGHVCAGNPALN